MNMRKGTKSKREDRYSIVFRNVIKQSNVFFLHFCGFSSNWILHYFPLFVCSSVTGVTSHISHIYKGINAMLIITHQTLYILNQNHPGYLSSKDQTRQDHLLRPDQPYHWLWLWIIKNINAESAVFTLSCYLSISDIRYTFVLLLVYKNTFDLWLKSSLWWWRRPSDWNLKISLLMSVEIIIIKIHHLQENS